jgi:hypothetical protein
VAFQRNYGQVAQLVERSPEKAGVGGSIPSLATSIFQTLTSVFVTEVCLGGVQMQSTPFPFPMVTHGNHPEGSPFANGALQRTLLPRVFRIE